MIWSIELAWIAEQMGIMPCRTFCECAIGPMDVSVAPGFIGRCKNMILVEPNPGLATNAAYILKMPITRAVIGFKHGKSALTDNGG